MDNHQIARTLREMADLLQIQEANPFRVRAYQNAAHTVDDQATPLEKMLADGADLTKLPGIGKEMASHIAELVETGGLKALEELGTAVPRSLIDVMRLPGVGPKKAKKLWQEIGATTVEEIEIAASTGRIAELDGFGARSQEKILEGIERMRRQSGRFRLGDADREIEPIVEALSAMKQVRKLDVAGSYRRRKETVGDIDLLAVSTKAEPVIEAFVSHPSVAVVDMAGETRASIVLGSGLQVDLRVLPPESYGAGLVYFTGSKEHNIKLRQRGVERGLKISEYGVFRVSEDDEPDDPRSGDLVGGRTEKQVYAAVDLPWIRPELREDRGEIEAAVAGGLPKVIESEDLKGDLQMHTTWSDGKASIEEMVAACEARGYSYLAITDHSKALAMAGGLDATGLKAQWKEIEKVQERHPKLRILKSMEVDILGDGRLDLEEEMLAQLDLVVVAIHSRFGMSFEQQTARLVKALQHPAVNVLAHPTGRKINRRAAYGFDLDEVFGCAKENGVALELNAHPARLDLRDTHLMLAREMGVKIVINTDAHSVEDLDLMHYGVEQAQRAWLTRGDVLNTLPVAKLLAVLGRA